MGWCCSCWYVFSYPCRLHLLRLFGIVVADMTLTAGERRDGADQFVDADDVRV